MTLKGAEPAAAGQKGTDKGAEPDIFAVTIRVEKNGETVIDRKIDAVEIYKSMITDATSIIIPSFLCSITDRNSEIWTRD